MKILTKINEFKNLWNGLKDIPTQIKYIRSDLNNVCNVIFHRPIKEKQFVIILIEAERIIKVRKKVRGDIFPEYMENQPTTEIENNNSETIIQKCSLADSGFISEHRHMFSFQPHYDIQKLRIAIFCDLSKVKITQVVICNESLSATYENCPIIYFDGKVGPGNRITIECEVR